MEDKMLEIPTDQLVDDAVTVLNEFGHAYDALDVGSGIK